MSVRPGDGDYEDERRQSLIEEDRAQHEEDHPGEILCQVCKEWHKDDEDCAYVDERSN